MTQWIDPQPVDVPAPLSDAVGGHPLVAGTLARRGVLTPAAATAFLDAAAYSPAPPTDLPGLVEAIERVRRAVESGVQIAIWGDFDADGQTATAALLEALQALGANVTFHVPGRDEGHGLHEPGLERLIAEGARLILTCDTGVTAHAAVGLANRLGAEVVITDHHVLGKQLPPAASVVNPHRLPSADHPLHPLVGVGVAYQLVRALAPAAAEGALDIVALGTVADVGALVGDNRYLVQRGLEALRRTERPGLLAIYEAADLQPSGLTEEHIGFVLGPRLNALGRLADAAHGVELLTTADRTRARTLATEVEGLNAQRQWLTKQIAEAALAQIQRDPAVERDRHALVLSHPAWPPGITGIVAGRLAERFGKPTVLISAPEGKLARGSGRSASGVNLIAALTDCAHLLAGYGGHPGAAGFSIESERIPELRTALSRAVAAQVEIIPEPTLTIDAYVELPELTLDLVADLNRLAPFGRGNPALTLAVRDVAILSEAAIGRTGEHRRVTIEDAQDRTLTVFWWHGAEWPLPRGRFDLALSLRTSNYRGVPEIQAEWLDARLRETEAVEVQTTSRIQIHDYRRLSNPEAMLHSLVAEGNVQVWAEGEHSAELAARNRWELTPTSRLALWTLPPGPRELREALDLAQPEEVLLFGLDPGMDESEPFLKRLAGLVSFALRARQGQVDLNQVAAVTAQRVAVVRAGLGWLAARGQIDVVSQDDDRWQLTRGNRPADPFAVDRARTQLGALLAETAAYRAYLLAVPAESLVG
jgi:single-stranded-DNA-specific exonuclease